MAELHIQKDHESMPLYIKGPCGENDPEYDDPLGPKLSSRYLRAAAPEHWH
jgi:hypothetical protein